MIRKEHKGERKIEGESARKRDRKKQKRQREYMEVRESEGAHVRGCVCVCLRARVCEWKVGGRGRRRQEGVGAFSIASSENGRCCSVLRCDASVCVARGSAAACENERCCSFLPCVAAFHCSTSMLWISKQNGRKFSKADVYWSSHCSCYGFVRCAGTWLSSHTFCAYIFHLATCDVLRAYCSNAIGCIRTTIHFCGMRMVLVGACNAIPRPRIQVTLSK